MPVENVPSKLTMFDNSLHSIIIVFEGLIISGDRIVVVIPKSGSLYSGAITIFHLISQYWNNECNYLVMFHKCSLREFHIVHICWLIEWVVKLEVVISWRDSSVWKITSWKFHLSVLEIDQLSVLRRYQKMLRIGARNCYVVVINYVFREFEIHFPD